MLTFAQLMVTDVERIIQTPEQNLELLEPCARLFQLASSTCALDYGRKSLQLHVAIFVFVDQVGQHHLTPKHSYPSAGKLPVA